MYRAIAVIKLQLPQNNERKLVKVPPGKQGTLATLKAMRAMVRKYKKDPVIMNLAVNLVSKLPEKNWMAEAKAIHEFVKNKIRYVRDVRGVETLHTPPKLLQRKQGDCDDKSTLAASLLESIGHPTRFIAVGFTPYRYSHVYLETKIGKRWVPLETTEKWPIGKAVKNPVIKLPVYN